MPRLVWLLALASAACSAPEPPPPSGLVPTELLALDAPVAAARERMEAMRPLVRQVDDDEAQAAPARDALEDLARETAWLLSRDDLAASPLAAARLRARVLFVTQGSAAARTAALDEAFALLEHLERGTTGS